MWSREFARRCVSATSRVQRQQPDRRDVLRRLSVRRMLNDEPGWSSHLPSKFINITCTLSSGGASSVRTIS